MTFARPILLLAVLLLAAGVVVAARPEGADAHPLGNFTVNHFTRIEVAPDSVSVFRVLDMAEIPAFQELQRIDADGDGEPSQAETSAWAEATADGLAKAMTLVIDGDEAALVVESANLTYPEGQGGLTLVRLEVTYRADLPGGAAEPNIAFTDDAYPDRIGWREVVVRAAPGAAIASSDVPETGVSDELRSYPEGQLASPLDVRVASFTVTPGAGSALEPAGPQHDLATRGNPDATLGGFTDLIAEKELSAGFVIVALLTAAAFGAIHALSPGHGKTIVAAYLVGSRGTLGHAALLGLVVTATHTSSVYALGLVTLYLSEFIVPEDLYPWMGLISGGIIVVMGASLIVGRLRATGMPQRACSALAAHLRRRPAMSLASERGSITIAVPQSDKHAGQGHDHAHTDEHTHDHEAGSPPHRHGWGPAHSHAIPGQDGEPVTWRRLVGLGVFGGMIPCPSAIVVMLSAIALHRVGFGLALIVAFSTGLALVLTGIGFAVVYAQRLPLFKHTMDRAESSRGPLSIAVRGIPVIAAVLVTAAGVVITTRAAGQF